MGETGRLFISYASEDVAAALDFCDKLATVGHAPWIDRRDLVGGQDWKLAILGALERAEAIVVLLSPRAVDKRGFLQREITEALDRAKETLPEDPFIIPVRLEPCDSPARLRHLQYIDLFAPEGFSQVLHSLALGAARRSKHSAASQTGELRMRTLETRSDAAPRFRIAVTYPELAGAVPDDVEARLNARIEEKARALMARIREEWLGRLEDWSVAELGEDCGQFIAEVRATLVSQSLVSLGGVFTADPANAVHPSHESLGWTWLLPSLVPVAVDDVFDESTAWRELVTDFCVRELSRQADVEESPTDPGWIARGVGELLSPDRSTSTCFTAENFVFVFDPEATGAYLWGTRSVLMPYRYARGYLAATAPEAIIVGSRKTGL